jgi:CHAT domain-containing protein
VAKAIRPARIRNASYGPLLAAAFLFSASCSQRPDKLFESAKLNFQSGHFPEASKLAEIGYNRFKGQKESEWRWKFAQLLAELQVFHGNTAGSTQFLSDLPPEQFAALKARTEMLRAYALSAKIDRYAESQALFQRALSDAKSSGDAEVQADVYIWLGMAQSKDFQAADREFQIAQQLAKKNHLDYQQAAAINDRGLIQLTLEHFADAIPLFEAARSVADKAGAQLISALGLNNLADCYENLGSVDRALELQKSSVQQLEKAGLETFLSVGYSDLGSMQMSKGDTAEGVKCFRRAFTLVDKDSPGPYALAAGNLADALQQTGALDEAERFNRIGLDLKRDSRAGPLLLTKAAIAERRAQYDAALAIYQQEAQRKDAEPSIRWQANAGLARVYAAKGDFSSADKSYAETLAVIAANRADQLQSDYKITFLSSLMHFYQDYVTLLMQHGDSDRALEIADSSRASVLAEALLGRSEASRKGLRAQIQKAAKASHSVFLFYWLAPKKSYLWAITGTQSKAVPLADEKQIEQDVESYRALIEERKADPIETPSRAGAQLYQELVAPVADFVPCGSRVVIVPDGPLHNLNFETLLVAGPQPHYWIEDATISIAPSLSILQEGKYTASVRRSLLVLGDPITAHTNYPALPEAAKEIANVQRQFPAADSKVYTGANAVVAAYSAAQPQRYSTIHFATHVDADARSPLDSAIILSPENNRFSLYARDVAQIPLNADLVTISACRGAGARTLTGEGLVGFAWAFFQAHARNVVTSLWDVYDPSTAELMNDFYSAVTAGQSYAAALRSAKLKMLGAKRYKSPYYWAPFQLYSRTIAAK